MIIEHIAIWTDDLEELKNYYIKYFDGVAGNKYVNEKKKFQSYFISFDSGARLEIMSRSDIQLSASFNIEKQYFGFAHLAFGVETKLDVDEKAFQLMIEGYKIISGPRVTGDGYYEFEILDPDNNRIEVTTKA